VRTLLNPELLEEAILDEGRSARPLRLGRVVLYVVDMETPASVPRTEDACADIEDSAIF
jgi:hypothetical protein